MPTSPGELDHLCILVSFALFESEHHDSWHTSSLTVRLKRMAKDLELTIGTRYVSILHTPFLYSEETLMSYSLS